MAMELHVYFICTVFSLLLFVTLSTELTCENLNCRNNECTEDGKCMQGCTDGYIIDDKGTCVKGCSGNCSRCNDDVCTECRSGYFGLQCLKACEGCINGSCEKTNGKCIDGCKHGYNNLPWCNISTHDHDHHHDHHHHRHHHHKAKTSKVEEEEKSRSLFIWIAGAIIMAVILAIVVLISIIVCSRGRNNSKSVDEAASERLNVEKGETTELE